MFREWPDFKDFIALECYNRTREYAPPFRGTVQENRIPSEFVTFLLWKAGNLAIP